MNLTTITLVAAVASAAFTVASAAVFPAAATTPARTQGRAIVVQDQASLRSAPRDGAQQQASLW